MSLDNLIQQLNSTYIQDPAVTAANHVLDGERLTYNQAATLIDEAISQNLNRNPWFIEQMYEVLFGISIYWSEEDKVFLPHDPDEDQSAL